MSNNLFDGYANVLDYGARSNSFQDETEAFKKALKTSMSVYVPEGIYYISETLELNNQNFIGSGIFTTQLVSINPDIMAPIIKAGRSCVIADILIKYKEGLLTGKENDGERVGIETSSNIWALQRGSTIRNVRIEEIGTAIYAKEHNTNKPMLNGPFSVHFDSIEITNFSYRGIDFKSTNRIGNVFTNIFMNSNKPQVDSMISLEGEDSEIIFNHIILDRTKCKTAINFRDVRTFTVTSFHIEGVCVSEPRGSMIKLNNSSGIIDILSIYYCPIDYNNISIITIDDGVYNVNQEWAPIYPNTETFLKIHTLHVKGLNDPPWDYFGRRVEGLYRKEAYGFNFFYRSLDAEGEYNVELDNYIWYTFQNDSTIYEDFPCDPHKRIHFLKKGILISGGPMSKRPIKRLCPYHTKYFDTDLGKEITWDGNDWK